MSTTTDRTPLLPQHTPRLEPRAIAFPAKTRNVVGSSEDDGLVNAHPEPLSHSSVPTDVEAAMPPVNAQGLPKISRECLLSEIQCYGKYIVAVLIVFGIGGVLIAFAIAGRRTSRS
ncbi:hypothetical protein SISNIDRAFT_453953 [Sistotremastrum niveocremeum HHB9708]|uniref:Uncharacterized protein n=1 Tax=Sistotremastrum niveocremeum HHB9708 TaxID=1314777 RepID=A0A164VJT6_9AGAM|nr:hypothetical protein SISNIDRAFT_453953 [Sistotremastrum niveocremeum HHB9708]